MMDFFGETLYRFRTGDIVMVKLQYQPFRAVVLDSPDHVIAKNSSSGRVHYYVQCVANNLCFTVPETSMQICVEQDLSPPRNKRGSPIYKNAMQASESEAGVRGSLKRRLSSETSEDKKKSNIDVYEFSASDESTASNDIYAPSTSKSGIESDRKLRSKKGNENLKNSCSNSSLKVGFLGLGCLGKRLVKKLLEAGIALTLWNRTAYKCCEFKNLGAVMMNSPSEVTAACDIIFCCVSDTEALKTVFNFPKGVIDSLAEGKGFVNLTTTDPEISLDIQESVTYNGGKYLEAPLVPAFNGVNGEKELILASGSRDLFESCIPCFDAMSEYVFFLGECPKANKMALVFSSLSGVFLAAFAECLSLLKRCNLPVDLLLKIIEQTNFSSPLVLTKGKDMIERNIEPHMPLKHIPDHITYLLEQRNDVSTPVIAATREVFIEAMANGHERHDVSAVHSKRTVRRKKVKFC